MEAERIDKLTYRSPLHTQLREVLRTKIDEGEYPPGTCIPSESQLVETYGLNRLSVRSAVAALEYEGLLHSVQGKGVFVAAPKLERDMESLGGFRQTMRERSLRPSTRVLIKALREAGPLYAKILGCAPKEDIWYVRRICLANGKPIALEEIFIPNAVVPGFEDVDINLFSIFEVYGWNGIHLVRGEQRLAITHLDPAAARLIGLKEENAVLEFSGASYDQDGRTIEFSRSYTHGERCEYLIHFER